MSALITIGEDELETATVKAINKAVRYSSSMRDTLRENILKVISEDKTDEKLEALNNVMNDKQSELMTLAKQNKDYSALANEIDELRAQKQKILVEIYGDHFKVTFKAGIEVEIKR